MAPSVPSASTHYALVVDAGSSGSRLQIYSWRDPDLERAEIVAEVREASRGRASGRKKWWWDGRWADWKGKGKAREGEMERSALRRLVRVGKGVEGDDWVKRVEPGISNMDPSEISDYLAPMLSHALRHIPPSQHATTPIYVLATAGMRLLPATTRDSILRATCDVVRQQYPFRVDGPSNAGPCGESVRVISGEEEGMWGWVAVNYLMDGFGHAPESTHTISAGSSTTSNLLPLAPLAEPPPQSSTDSVTPVDVHHHSPTFGFLDMGGASTQLAFSPSEGEIAKSGYPTTDLRNVQLRLLSGEDVEWPVFVASWLGFGTNRVRERYVDSLIDRWRSDALREGRPLDLDTPIPDPCLPTHLDHPSEDPLRYPDLVGTGAFSSCLNDLRPLLDDTTPCPTEHCLFGGVSTPRIDFQRDDQRGFIGISEYWYTAQQVLGLGGVWDWGEWEKGMSEFCKRPWSTIQEQVKEEKGWRGAQVELSRLQTQCFKGAWISNVLHEGIGIPRLVDHGGNDTLTGGQVGDTNAEAERRAREKGLLEGSTTPKHHFQSMDEVGETAISWTLGKMVIEASRAVPPRSYAVEQAWASRVPGVALGQFEQRLNAYGIQTIWAYGFMAFGLLACLFTGLRRKCRSSPSYRRVRKPSVSGDSPISFSSSKWSWLRNPWTGWSDESGYSSLEEGIDLSPAPPPKNGATLGRMRLWALRLGHTLRRNIPFGAHNTRPRPMRHVSLPLTVPFPSSGSGYASLPPSPRANSSSYYFTPVNTLSVPPNRPPSTSPELRHVASASSIEHSPSSAPHSPLSTSPPRSHRGRSARNYPLSLGIGDKPFSSSSSSSGPGWNDPPVGMFGQDHTHGGSSSLMPSAYGGVAVAGESSLSRNSSRVNLSEMGLAQRSTSRAATPQPF